MLEIETIPCRQDNYAFLAHDPATGSTTLVDAPAAQPVLDRLDQKGWTLDQVLLTHHHGDHVEGLPGLLARHKATVVGHAADAKRLPPLDLALSDGDTLQIGDVEGIVIDVSGHTLGHVAFHFPEAHVVFTADSLMALGCGRVFEGTKAQMHMSLQRLAALPPETLVCSGHEYTEANAAFALSIDPDNPALATRVADIKSKRAKGEATVPSMLGLELMTNPFLRAHDTKIRKQLGMETATDSEVFTEIRTRKDNF